MGLVWSSPHPRPSSSPSFSVVLFQVRTFVESHILLKWTVCFSEAACDWLAFAIISVHTVYPHLWLLLLAHMWLLRTHFQHNNWTVPPFSHWYSWIFIHSLCLDHETFLRGAVLGILPAGWSGLFPLDGSIWVPSLRCMEISQASILTAEVLGWLNWLVLIYPGMQDQGIPESRWNANEIDLVHLLGAVNSQDLEPVQPLASC